MNRSYSSGIAYCLPFSLLALPFLLAGIALFFMGITSQQMHGAYVHRLCLIAGAVFCLGCVRSLLRAAFRDYYVQIRLDDSGILLRKPFETQRLEWSQIKLLSQSESTLTITTIFNTEIELSSSVSDFNELCGQIRQKHEERKKKS